MTGDIEKNIEHDEEAREPERMDVRRILLAWERLRIAYNIVLFIVVILTFGFLPAGDPYFFIKAAFWACIANLLFCAGPAFELYVSWLFGRKFDTGSRLAVFLAGTALASCLAFLYTLGYWMVQVD